MPPETEGEGGEGGGSASDELCEVGGRCGDGGDSSCRLSGDNSAIVRAAKTWLGSSSRARVGLGGLSGGPRSSNPTSGLLNVGVVARLLLLIGLLIGLLAVSIS